MHYAQPLALHRQGVLFALYTDWYNDHSLPVRAAIAATERFRPHLAQKMRQRRHSGLNGVSVFHHPLFGMVLPAVQASGQTLGAIRHWALARIFFAQSSRGPLAGHPAYPDAVAGPMHCFGADGVRLYQSRGIRVVVDQVIAPYRELFRQQELQRQFWPGWEPASSQPPPQSEIDQEEQTLAAVDHIVAPSRYVVESLAAIGHGPDRVSLLEYPLDASVYRPVDRTNRSGPMVLGFVGSVNLRKGIPWLVESLKLLDPALFRCVVVGPIGLNDYGMVELKKVAEVVGPVPRAQVRAWLEKFDVFFFPSTCEGSPTVVAEAMATGLPVITSVAGGQLIREGIDGFVCSYDQPSQYAQCISILAKDKDRRLAMGAAARQRVEQFSVDAYGRGLRKIIEGVVAGPAAISGPPKIRRELDGGQHPGSGPQQSAASAASPVVATPFSKAIRVVWLIKGDEDGGVAQAVRGLATAAAPLGVAPVILSFSDGPFARECARRGWEMHVLTLEPPPGLAGGPVHKIFTYVRLRHRTVELVPVVARAVRDCGAQVLHVLWPNLVPLAGMASHLAGVRCFWEMPNVMARFPFSLNRRVLGDALARYQITALANSQYTQASLDPAGRRSLLFYLGADPARFYPGHPDAVRRAELEIPADAIVLGIVARLCEEKGQKLVLRAIAALLPQNNMHLLLVGGPLGTPFHRELLTTASSLRCKDRVHFTGNVPDPERYYDLINLPVNAYLGAESFGLSVVEAMMAGKPILVHALGGPAETVLDGQTGWHVTRATVDAFQAGLVRALVDRPKWPQMSKAARQRALDHFNLEAQARRYADILLRPGVMGTPAVG
ncbi:MAG: glycosyltransferase family 4 protein [Planctomycetia bacterium]|nr:glycosyltransferase family 4 protein [Planctomycetia bacterium]